MTTDPRSWNTHTIGLLGLYVGAASIVVPPVAAFFKLLSDYVYLRALAMALVHLSIMLQHGPAVLMYDDQIALAKVGAALFAMIGGFVVALLLAYFGRPKTV